MARRNQVVGLQVIQRYETDPPDESYETVLRDVQDLVQNMTPDDAFVLVWARYEGDDLAAQVCYSAGRIGVAYSTLDTMAQTILNNYES